MTLPRASGFLKFAAALAAVLLQFAQSAPAAAQLATTPPIAPLRVSPRDARFLETSDGRTFLAIGMNAAWYKRDAEKRYAALFDKMRRNRMNLVRIWLPTWALSVDSARPGGIEPAGAARADRILDLAAAAEIKVVLCIENTADFTGHYNRLPWGSLSDARTAETFFSSKLARDAYDEKLRGLAARWSGHSALGAWELWNEIDLVAQPIFESAEDQGRFLDKDVLPWARHSASVLREADSTGRLVTVSLSGDLTWPALWRSREMDMVQVHSYAPPPGETRIPLDLDFARRVRANVRVAREFGKPVLPAEVDFAPRGADEAWIGKFDPKGLHLKDALWSSVMCGSAGSAMPWWWEDVERLDLFPRFASVAAFFEGTDLAGERLQTICEPQGAPLDLFGMSGPASAYAWLRDPATSWHRRLVLREPLREWTDAAVTLTDLEAGAYDVVWWDTDKGAAVDVETLTVKPDGLLRLAAPPFKGDIAVKARKKQ
jgi:hypothetical protein